METEPETLRKFQKELNAGTVSLVVLAYLNAAREPMYGYRIAKHHLEDELATIRRDARPGAEAS